MEAALREDADDFGKEIGDDVSVVGDDAELLGILVLELLEGQLDDPGDLLVVPGMKRKLLENLDEHETEEEVHGEAAFLQAEVAHLLGLALGRLGGGGGGDSEVLLLLEPDEELLVLLVVPEEESAE